MKKALAILSASTLLLTGCGATETHVVMFRSAKAGSGEADLYVESVPPRPFVEVGLLQAIGTGDEASTPRVLAALRAEGRKQGCDAIVLARGSSGNLSAHASGMCVLWAPP